MKITVLFFTVLSIFHFHACGEDDDDSTPTTNPPEILGMSFTKSNNTFDKTYDTLQSSLAANPNIRIVTEVNHQMNASSVGLMLEPTRVIFFGNPNLGTPLMQRNQLAGLDLPQKILVYQNELEEVFLGFNNPDFLSPRHGS